MSFLGPRVVVVLQTRYAFRHACRPCSAPGRCEESSIQLLLAMCRMGWVLGTSEVGLRDCQLDDNRDDEQIVVISCSS